MNTGILPKTAYVALGANLGDPPAQLRFALDRLREAESVHLGPVSDFYRSPPLGPPGQPDYCNAVCVLQTALQPETLLALLQSVEDAAGRRRDGPRWGPRTLDLDLLHVEGEQRDTAVLRLPHPQLHLRSFVLRPLAQIAAGLVIPGLGSVSALSAAVGSAGVVPWFGPADPPEQ